MFTKFLIIATLSFVNVQGQTRPPPGFGSDPNSPQFGSDSDKDQFSSDSPQFGSDGSGINPYGDSTSSSTDACLAGKSRSSTGACVPCVKGKYKSTVGNDECTICPANKYQPKEGQSMCLACPTGTTSEVGAVLCKIKETTTKFDCTTLGQDHSKCTSNEHEGHCSFSTANGCQNLDGSSSSSQQVGGGDISNCQNEGGHIPNQASCKCGDTTTCTTSTDKN